MADYIALVRPGAGRTVTQPVGPAARLEFAFDQSDAVLSKEDQDLVFTFSDGGKLTLEGFYNNFGDNAKPPTLVVEGNELPGETFLAALNNPDLMPAAGPAAGPPMGGGSYEDALLTGVAGTAGLENAFPGDEALPGMEREGPTADTLTLGAVGGPAAPGGAIPGGGGEPPPVEPPPPPAPLMARGVLYTQDTSAGQAKLTVDLLAEKAASTGEALPAAGDVNFLFYDKDGNGPLSSSPFAAVYAPDGSITFTYSGSYSAPGVYYCVINDSAGHSYSMQLVVTADTFDSANPEYALPAGWALWDTWHEGQNASTGYSGVGYRVASSDVNDSLSFMGQLYQAAVAAGDGDNTISVSASADNGNAYAMNTSYITTGNGDDSITISAQGDAGSYAMQNSYITTGDGDDSITISAQGGTGNYAMQNSYITTGDGDDSITISAQGGTDSYAMQNSDITTGGGADHVTLIGDVVSTTANAHKIDLGAGNDSLMITGNVSGMDLDGGANDLIFHADDDGGIAVLGDILGLTSANYADVLAAGNANTIKNFESLLVDMQDNSETLDALLAGVDNLQTKQGIPSGANDNGHVQSLIVTTSNGADELKLGSVALDVAAQVHSEVTIEGVVGCFTHYQIDVGSGPLDLYIQQELLKA